MPDIYTHGFAQGVHNLKVDHEIPASAASDSLGWISKGDKIELARGKIFFGDEIAGLGKCTGLFWAKRLDGASVGFAKRGTSIQYYDADTESYIDVIGLTGLGALDPYYFTSYQSLAGSFVLVCGLAGLFKIPTANPGSAVNLSHATKNLNGLKGQIRVFASRLIAWDLPNDKTGIYGSWIDEQNYTTVSNENIGTGDGSTVTFNATLSAITGTRTAFGVQVTAGAIILSDDGSGRLTGNGGSGTINYATGAVSVTFDTPPAGAVAIEADYQWEDSNNHGISDFTKSGTRQAGEGFIFRQDEGGSATRSALVQDKVIYSLKRGLIYFLNLTADDTNAENLPFRYNSGIESPYGAVATSLGIVYMDVYDPENPQLVRLQPNLAGDKLVPNALAKHFDFSKFEWDEAAFEVLGKYIVFSGKTRGSDNNNRLFLYDSQQDSVDIIEAEFDILAQDLGQLYAADSLSYNVVLALNGFDDLDDPLNNYWISKRDPLQTEEIKKVKKLTLEGFISADMIVEVYEAYDADDFELVGYIRGDGAYVDHTQSFTVGAPLVGEGQVGGGGDYPDGIEVSPFGPFQIRLRTPKFYRRRLKFVATTIGYVAITGFKDWDVRQRGHKVPRKYRDETQSPI